MEQVREMYAQVQLSLDKLKKDKEKKETENFYLAKAKETEIKFAAEAKAKRVRPLLFYLTLIKEQEAAEWSLKLERLSVQLSDIKAKAVQLENENKKLKTENKQLKRQVTFEAEIPELYTDAKKLIISLQKDNELLKQSLQEAQEKMDLAQTESNLSSLKLSEVSKQGSQQGLQT